MNKEIILDPNKEILSTTDKTGVIIDTNDYFCEISGFTEDELIGADHNIIRHPDMPKAIFRLMWTALLKDKTNFKGVIKNLAKDNDYYWVITDFEFEDIDGEIIYTAKRTNPKRKLIERIDYIYKRMKEIEEEYKNDNPIKHSLKFLEDIIRASGYKDYNEFIEYLTKE